MASPPFNLDTSDPSDNSIGDVFPANERAFRDNVNSYLNTEHDINTGHHAFPELTTTQKTSLTTPPAGMLVFDTTLTQLQINNGTPSAPVWINATGKANPQGLFDTTATKTSNYSLVATDTNTLFNNYGATAAVTFTLPSTTNLPTGYIVAFFNSFNSGGASAQVTIAVNGGNSELIDVPGQGRAGQALASVSLYVGFAELIILSYDGQQDWIVLTATPNTWQKIGAVNNTAFRSQLITSTGAGTITIASPNAKVTMIGAGGGGGGADTTPTGSGAPGGAGGFIIAWIYNMTIGDTLNYSVGAGGTGGTTGSPGNSGSSGGNTTISSGTQAITTRTASGGGGGGGGNHAGTAIGGSGGAVAGAAQDFTSTGMPGSNCATVSVPSFATPLMQYGSGGDPGGYNGGGTAQPGDTGAGGAIIVEWLS